MVTNGWGLMNGAPSGMDDLSLGELLVRQGFVTFNQVHECLLLQKRQPAKRLGEILLEHGHIRPEQLHLILDLQSKGRAVSKIVVPGYEIYEKIGHGAMGAVYRARQLSFDRPVALKVLSAELSNDPTFVERFLREARAVARLSHPNIVAGIDAGEVGGLHYYVMEFIDGTTTQGLLRSRGTLSETECARIGAAVARALDHASHHGIIHRDVKPQNIMVGKEGTVKLCDLGLAKRLGNTDPSLTADGIAIGTPYYISPELARGEHDVDIRSDLYSLGATLYHLATGEPPFRAENYALILKKHVSEAPLHPRRVIPSLSEEFCRILLRCLEKTPADRYLHPAQVAQDFEALLSQRSTTSPLPSKATGRRSTILDRRPTHITHSRSVVAPRRDKGPAIVMASFLTVALALLFIILTSRPFSVTRPTPVADPGPASEAAPPSQEASDALFGKRLVEYRRLRDSETVVKVYEFLLKCYVELASTPNQALWQKEIDAFEREKNEQILRQHWRPLAERIEQLRIQGKLGAALETVEAFPDAHRYFLQSPTQTRMTSAGEAAKRTQAALLAQVDREWESILPAFHRALEARQYDAALAETDRLVPLAHGAARQDQVDDLRESVLADVVTAALVPPIAPSDIADARRTIVRCFDRYTTNPRISGKIDHQLIRLDEEYAEELKRSSAALLKNYDSVFQKPFDRLLLRRHYSDARRLVIRLLRDPALAHLQTCLCFESVPQDWLVAQLEKPRLNVSEYPGIVRRLEEYLAVANARDEFQPLGRLLGDVRALYVLEWLIERAAAQLTVDGKSLTHPDFAGGRVIELSRAPSAGAVFRLRLANGAEKDLHLAPMAGETLNPEDVLALASSHESDPYFDLQAALLYLYCAPPREKEVRQWARKMTDWAVKTVWDQYEARLKTLPSLEPLDDHSFKPTIESLFSGSIKLIDVKKNHILAAYDFSQPRHVDDFIALRTRPGIRFAVSPSTAGVLVEGNGAALWKADAKGWITLETTFIPSTGRNLVLFLGSSDRKSGYALCLDCSVGNTDLTPGKQVRADHGMAIVRLPLDENHPLLASNRLTPVQPGAFAAGKPVKVRLMLSASSIKAQVEGLKGTNASVELQASTRDAWSGSFGIWTWGSDVKITSLAIETLLDESWVKRELSQFNPK